MVHGIWAADSRGLSVRSTFPVLWDAMFGRAKAGGGTGSLVWNLVSSGLFAGRRAKTDAEEERAREERDAWASLGALDAERKKWSVYGLKGGLGILTERIQVAAREAGVTIKTGCDVGRVRHTETGKVTVSQGVAFHARGKRRRADHSIADLARR